MSSDFQPSSKRKFQVWLYRQIQNNPGVTCIVAIPDGSNLNGAEKTYYETKLSKELSAKVDCSVSGVRITPESPANKRQSSSIPSVLLV